MSNLMLCDHKKTKKKLVAWATDCKGKHEQGFKMKECCCRCGKQVGQPIAKGKLRFGAASNFPRERSERFKRVVSCRITLTQNIKRWIWKLIKL